MFWFKLALALGMSVRQAQDEISAVEFAEWLAYNRIDPIGNDRADLRAGIIAATLVNVNLAKGKRARKPKEFMPKYETKQERQMMSKAAQMKQTLINFTIAKRGKLNFHGNKG